MRIMPRNTNNSSTKMRVNTRSSPGELLDGVKTPLKRNNCKRKVQTENGREEQPLPKQTKIDQSKKAKPNAIRSTGNKSSDSPIVRKSHNAANLGDRRLV